MNSRHDRSPLALRSFLWSSSSGMTLSSPQGIIDDSVNNDEILTGDNGDYMATLTHRHIPPVQRPPKHGVS